VWQAARVDDPLAGTRRVLFGDGGVEQAAAVVAEELVRRLPSPRRKLKTLVSLARSTLRESEWSSLGHAGGSDRAVCLGAPSSAADPHSSRRRGRVGACNYSVSCHVPRL
jgi:hypothetical protein